MVGAEALIRWNRPDGSVTLPGEFIPLAHETGLIREITRHMLPKLIDDLLILHAIPYASGMIVSFNASAFDLEDTGFVREVLHLLEKSRIPPHLLQIELTETIALNASEQVRNNILALREAGVELAMDDYGIGYSSIDTLSIWPFTAIKLDQGIVGRMLESPKNLTIVESAIRMAHELGISVVAEGVETQEQFAKLLEAGCTKIQGYWISRAVPLDQFISFVELDLRWGGLPVGLIHMAILDHVQWRKKLVSEIVKAASSDRTAAARHCLDLPPMVCSACRLGKWYYGLGSMFADRSEYQAIDAPHRRLHEIGQQLVDTVRQGALMAELVEPLRALSHVSMELLAHLQHLENSALLDSQIAQEQWKLHHLYPHNWEI